MAFFQNKNTQTAAFAPPVLVANGFDFFDIDLPSDTNWTNFLSLAKHAQRKEALEEFIVIIYYLKNRQIAGNNFPHPDIYNNFFKYLIKHDGTTNDPIPRDSSNADLFTKTSGPELHHYNFSSSALKHIVFLSESQVKCNLRQAIINGDTTKSAIVEGCTLFGFYYLIRTLALVNGYTKDYLANALTGYKLFQHSTTYSYPTVDDLTGLGVVNKVNKPAATDHSYFYLSLLDTLFSSGFINNPGSVTGSTFGSLTPDYKQYYSLLTLLFDPFNKLGNFDYTLGTSTTAIELRKNLTDPPGDMPTLTAIGELKSMSGHLYSLIYKGNFSGTPLIFPNRYFDITFPGGALADVKVNLIRRQVDSIITSLNRDVIEPAILNESNLLFKCLMDTSLPSFLPTTKFLGSGVGTTTVGFLGIQDLGITFFSYFFKDGLANAETTNNNNTIVVNRRVENVIKLSVFGIDHPEDGANEFSRLIIENNEEKYYFYCNKNNQQLRVNLVTPNLFNYPANRNILTTTVTGTKVTFRSNLNAGRTGTITPIVIAEFEETTGDLTIFGFSNSECSTYGISPTPNYKITLISEIQDVNTGIINSTTNAFTLDKSHYTVVEEIILIASKTENDPINLSLTDNFAPDKFVYTGGLFTSDDDAKIINLIKMIKAGDATFANPKLEGYFVGKPALTIIGGASRIDQDTSFYPSTSAPSQEIDGTSPSVTVAQRNSWKALRHSFAKIHLTIDTSSSCKYLINIEVSSFVDPSISHLDTKINPGTGNVNITTLRTNFTKWPTYPAGPSSSDYYVTLQSMQKIPSYNPVLAMLRSFGVFVAICDRFDELANLGSVGTNPTYTTEIANLKNNAQSIDKSFSNPLTSVITLTEYNTFKP